MCAPDGAHPGMTTTPAKSPLRPAITDATGVPVMRVEALLARLNRTTSQADINQVCDALAIVTDADTNVEHHLWQWTHAVIYRAVPLHQSMLATADQEVVHMEALDASQTPSAAPVGVSSEPIVDLPILIEELLLQASEYSAAGWDADADDLLEIVDMLQTRPGPLTSEDPS